MGTRGFWGFELDGERKLTYNHFDSYPEGLGKDLIKGYKATELVTLKDRVRALVLVEDDVEPTRDDFIKYGMYWDEGVSTGKDWYSLLRHVQGDFEAQLAAGIMVATDIGGWQEYGYVFDLDKEVLRLYDGDKVVGEVSLDEILNDPDDLIDLESYYEG